MGRGRGRRISGSNGSGDGTTQLAFVATQIVVFATVAAAENLDQCGFMIIAELGLNAFG